MSSSILRSTEYVKCNRCRIKFHTHHNPFTDDKQYAYSPELNTNGEVRVYTVTGKANLNDAALGMPHKCRQSARWGHRALPGDGRNAVGGGPRGDRLIRELRSEMRHNTGRAEAIIQDRLYDGIVTLNVVID